jgi:molecular chaperone GrpE
MFRPVFQSSTLSVRRQANNFSIRAATVTATATPVVGNNPTSTSTTTTRSASTLTTQLHNNKNNNNNLYGVIAVTPQSSSSSSSSHYRRWFSDAGKTTASTDEEDNENNKDKDDNDTDDAVAEEDGANSTDDEVSNEASEIEIINKLKNELSDMKNQLLRSLAEQENIRSIARRDVQTAKDFSTKSFAKSLLEVADNLDRALESVNNDTEESTTTDSAEQNSTLKSFVEGIELTNIGLIKSLQSNGVESFCELPGDEFNPDKHQALMEYVDPTSKLLPGTIGVVMKKGYTLNKRVLRPAEVGVIKK